MFAQISLPLQKFAGVGFCYVLKLEHAPVYKRRRTDFANAVSTFENRFSVIPIESLNPTKRQFLRRIKGTLFAVQLPCLSPLHN